MNNIIKADFPNYFDAGSYPASQRQPFTELAGEVDPVQLPELLESNRNLDKVLTQLNRFGVETTSLADEPGIVNLAHRALRTRLVENGYLARDEKVVFDMTDAEAVKIAMLGVMWMQTDRKITKSSKVFRHNVFNIPKLSKEK